MQSLLVILSRAVLLMLSVSMYYRDGSGKIYGPVDAHVSFPQPSSRTPLLPTVRSATTDISRRHYRQKAAESASKLWSTGVPAHGPGPALTWARGSLENRMKGSLVP